MKETVSKKPIDYGKEKQFLDYATSSETIVWAEMLLWRKVDWNAKV